jgi:hypothetical protein
VRLTGGVFAAIVVDQTLLKVAHRGPHNALAVA